MTVLSLFFAFVKKAAPATLAGLLLTLVTATPAFGHAILLSAEPAIDIVQETSPERVVLQFNEPVEIAFGAVRVFDAAANRVDQGRTRYASGRADQILIDVTAPLAEGTYTVTWRVISADSHPVQGAFIFHVGAPGAQARGIAQELLAGEAGAGRMAGILYGITRWVNFSALLILAGGAIFAVRVWRRAEGAGSAAGEVDSRFTARWRRLMIWAWWAAVVATAASVLLLGAIAGGVSLSRAATPEILAGVFSTRFGRVAVGKAVLLALGALLWVVAGRRRLHPVSRDPKPDTAGPAPGTPGWVRYAGGAIGLGLLATPGLAGHAGATDPAALNLLADTLHMAAAAAWTGGLVVLLAVAFPAGRGMDDADRVTLMAPVVTRFSRLALISVAVLVATGSYRSLMEVRALQALTGTEYGVVLITKLALFAPLLGLGLVNRKWTVPGIREAAASGQPSSALGRLRRIVKVELAFVAAVLVATALLVNLPPARVDGGVSGPFFANVSLGENNLHIAVYPNQVGENQVHLTATTPQGAPAEIEGALVRFRMPEQDIGPIVSEGLELGPGHFVVQGRELSVAGEWTMAIEMRVDEFTNARTEVTLRVGK